MPVNFLFTEIVKNESKKVRIDEYRLVMLNYDAAWDNIYKDMQSATGYQLSEHRKGILLLKLDPFEKKWKIAAQDLSNRDRDFHTKNVEILLEKIE